MADWKHTAGIWLGAVGGVTGISGLIFGVAGWRIALRGTRANERSASAAESSAQAADSSAQSAAEAVDEARTISKIEMHRRHGELAPADLSVTFTWRLDNPTGGVWAEVNNASPHDFEAEPILISASGGRSPLVHTKLGAKSTSRIYLGPLDVPAIASRVTADAYEDRRIMLLRGPGVRAAFDEAYRQASGRFELLELRHRSSAEPCPCAGSPPSHEYGHWITRHPIENVEP